MQDQQEQTDRHKTEWKRKKQLSKKLLFLLLFLCITALELLVFIPKVKETMAKADIPSLIAKESKKQENNTSLTSTVYFYHLNGTLRAYHPSLDKNNDLYHGTFEVLLKGPDKTVLEDLSLTYIPEKTRLLGITVAKGITYLNLSADLLDSNDLTKAINQLKATANGLKAGNTFVLLIDGKAYRQDS
ncbi:MAG: GerMN domain-containing protein [Spirochaetia bacterium]|jgi:hypothetical protein|nr:GerMN domain-containing protein [Spirochaetia bacterium]